MSFDDTLKQLFPDDVESRGGELYVHPRILPEVIQLCNERRFAILGIEVFEARPQGITPRMDLILDNSMQGYSGRASDFERFNASSKKFIELIPVRDDILVNFAVDDD